MSHNPLVAIPDLPFGNIGAIANMVARAGGRPKVIERASDLHLDHVDRLILCGVGSFDWGMRGLKKTGWLSELNEVREKGQIPILGICLGMQLMCRGSEEGESTGLGWFDANVVKIRPDSPNLKVPHMGWNRVKLARENRLIEESDDSRFYFVHSYHVRCNDPSDVLATTVYGSALTAAICKGHVFGTQFHPEKSHYFGLSMIRNFCDSSLLC